MNIIYREGRNMTMKHLRMVQSVFPIYFLQVLVDVSSGLMLWLWSACDEHCLVSPPYAFYFYFVFFLFMILLLLMLCLCVNWTRSLDVVCSGLSRRKNDRSSHISINSLTRSSRPFSAILDLQLRGLISYRRPRLASIKFA